jgi:hypothetical protein
MQQRNHGFATVATQPARRTPRRVPIGDIRGTSAHPQLLIVTVSLALWTAIIATLAMLVG